MKKKIIYGIISICLVIFGLFTFFSKNKNEKDQTIVNAEVDLNLNCGSAFLIEETTGKVLYAKNETNKMYPASMTKMMGLLLVCEALEEESIHLDDMVSISTQAASMGGSQVFLEPLELMSVDELLKCVCIASANDAMYALSEHICSSNDIFIQKMNEKSKILRLENTNFVNVTGFDDENHYTCAKDMATIAKELLKYKNFILHYTSMYDSHIRENTEKPFWLVNTNKMVKYYSGMDGLKTGYTSKAGFCLTATASRNNVRMISVIMKAESSSKRNEMTKILLDYGFNRLKGSKLYEANSQIATICINKAKKENIPVYCKEEIILIYENKLEMDKINKEIVLKDNLMAPININDEIGYLKITYNDNIYTYPLIVKESIDSISIKELFLSYLKDVLF